MILEKEVLEIPSADTAIDGTTVYQQTLTSTSQDTHANNFLQMAKQEIINDSYFLGGAILISSTTYILGRMAQKVIDLIKDFRKFSKEYDE